MGGGGAELLGEIGCVTPGGTVCQKSQPDPSSPANIYFSSLKTFWWEEVVVALELYDLPQRSTARRFFVVVVALAAPFEQGPAHLKALMCCS